MSFTIKKILSLFIRLFIRLHPIFAYALSILVPERENWKPQCNLTWLEATGRAKTNKLTTYSPDRKQMMKKKTVNTCARNQYFLFANFLWFSLHFFNLFGCNGRNITQLVFFYYPIDHKCILFKLILYICKKINKMSIDRFQSCTIQCKYCILLYLQFTADVISIILHF